MQLAINFPREFKLVHDFECNTERINQFFHLNNSYAKCIPSVWWFDYLYIMPTEKKATLSQSTCRKNRLFSTLLHNIPYTINERKRKRYRFFVFEMNIIYSSECRDFTQFTVYSISRMVRSIEVAHVSGHWTM